MKIGFNTQGGKMKKIGIIWGLLIGAILISGCSIRTPEIHGVVLDAETKQPVGGAWVTATLGIKTKTIGGDSHTYLSVDPPHTRSDKDGKFVIHAKGLKKMSFPVGFGTDVETFGAGADTADDRGGSIDLKHFLGKEKAEIIIYVKPEEMTESEYFSHLQALYNYCLTGRFAFEVPAVEGGCDNWEMDYAIKKHERYLERLGAPAPKSDQGGHYAGTLYQLGYLLKKRGYYSEALITFKKLKEYSRKRQTESLYSYEFEVVMPQIEQLLDKKNP
jgi:hypothetical protein